MGKETSYNISFSFKLLINSIEEKISTINANGSEAIKNGDYDGAQEAIEYAKQIKAFQSKVASLHAEWKTLSGDDPAEEDDDGEESYEEEEENEESYAEEEDVKSEKPGVVIDRGEFSFELEKISPTHWRYNEPLPKGSITPRSRFYIPILIALNKLGGSARVSDVLEEVELLLEDGLTDRDYELLPSTPNQARWNNATRWARHDLVKSGYLQSNSPHGIWALTEKSHDFLKRINEE